MILSIFGDIWMDCIYIYTSGWSGSCSEEGPLFEDASSRLLCETLVLGFRAGKGGSLRSLKPRVTNSVTSFLENFKMYGYLFHN